MILNLKIENNYKYTNWGAIFHINKSTLYNLIGFILEKLKIKKISIIKYCLNSSNEVSNYIRDASMYNIYKIKLYYMGCCFPNGIQITSNLNIFRTILYYEYCFSVSYKLQESFQNEKILYDISSYGITYNKYNFTSRDNLTNGNINSLYLSKNLIKFHSIL